MTETGPGVMHHDGMTRAYLAALRERPQSARDLAATLGQSVSRSNVAALRGNLEWMERRGWVQRSRTGTDPWIWEVSPDLAERCNRCPFPASCAEFGHCLEG